MSARRRFAGVEVRERSRSALFSNSAADLYEMEMAAAEEQDIVAVNPMHTQMDGKQKHQRRRSSLLRASFLHRKEQEQKEEEEEADDDFVETRPPSRTVKELHQHEVMI